MTDNDEIVDGEGYPTEAALDHIRSFSGTPQELADFIAEIWWPHNPLGIDGPAETEILDGDLRRVVEFAANTRGHAGNESILTVLRATKFWARFWYMSRRDGVFEFRADPTSWNEHDYLGENWWTKP